MSPLNVVAIEPVLSENTEMGISVILSAVRILVCFNRHPYFLQNPTMQQYTHRFMVFPAKALSLSCERRAKGKQNVCETKDKTKSNTTWPVICR